jgi:putative peptidoglycan lipid II flippase
MWATAFALGASGLMSAYSIANNIPNMIFELVAGGILSSLFIPTFMELRAEKGDDGAWEFASHVFNIFVLLLGLIAAVGILLPQPFIWTQTFRLSTVDARVVRDTAEFFFRFFAVQVVFYGGGMVMQGLLNAHRKYLWTALGPVFNNLVVIGTMFVFAAMPDSPLRMTILAIGTSLGVVMMFAVMIPSLMKSGIRYTPRLGLSDPAVRRMLVLALPTLLYVVTNLVAVSFRNASALAVADEGPSVLMYAWTFYQLPYGILAVALATAVFTELADAAGRKDMTALKDHFSTGLRTTGVLMLPAAALLIALAEPLVSLYRIGAFKAEDVAPVANALRFWAAGLVFYAGMMFVLRTFYSLKDTRTPMLANLVLTPLQIGLYLVLSTGMLGWPGLGIIGIPIADGIFYSLLFVTLALLLRRRIGGYDLRGVARTFATMLFASALGGAVAFGVAALLAPPVPGFSAALIQVSVAGAVGLVVAFGIGRLLGVAEVMVATGLVMRVLRRRSDRTPKG